MSNVILQRTQETANFFQVSKMTLHRWRKEKDFPHPLKRGGVVLYNIQAIQNWLKMGEAAND